MRVLKGHPVSFGKISATIPCNSVLRGREAHENQVEIGNGTSCSCMQLLRFGAICEQVKPDTNKHVELIFQIQMTLVRHFFPLDLVFVTWTVLPTNLQYVGQGKQGLSVVLEAARSRRSLAGQQGHHPTPTTPALCKIVHTQSHRERMDLP